LDDLAVSIRTITLLMLPFILSGCSYIYDVLAVVRGGRVVFIVNPKSSKQPTCLRRVEVTAGNDTDRKSVV
jgi:hypothetical protein